MTELKVLPRNWTTVADSNIAITALKPSGFLFPFPSFYLYRLLTSYNRAITESAFLVEGSIIGPASYEFKPEPLNNGTLPPFFRLYIEDAANNRWWSQFAILLEETNFYFAVELRPELWNNVSGLLGNDNPDTLEQFHQVLLKPSRLGLAFGGGSFTHGARVIEGSSNFVVRKASLI